MRASPYEKAIWQSWLIDKNDPSLVLNYAFEIKGQIDTKHLLGLLNLYVTKHHPICGLSFKEDNGILKKEHIDSAPESISIEKVVQKKLEEQLNAFFLPPMNLQRGPLYKFKLFYLGKQNYVLALRFSHIVFDGCSYNDFFRFLTKIDSEDSQILPLETITPPAYSEENIDFWKEFISKRESTQSLLFTNVTDSGFKNCTLQIEGKEYNNIKNLLRKNSATIFQYICSVTTILVNKYNKSEEGLPLLLGHTVNASPVNSRPGCLTNLNPLLVPYTESNNIEIILKNIKASRLASKPHQHTPYMEILPAIREVLPNFEFFNIFINHSPGLINFDALSFGEAKVKTIQSPSSEGPYKLGVIYNHNEKSLSIQMNIRGVTDAQIKEISENFRNLLINICTSPEKKLSDFNLIASCKKIEGIRKEYKYGLVEILHTSFEKYADSIAVIHKNKTYTYSEIKDKINFIINHIDKKVDALTKTPTVGIYFKRSENLLLSVLSSICGGYCFVPLDPSYPKSRLEIMMKDSHLDLVLTDKHTLKGDSFLRSTEYSTLR